MLATLWMLWWERAFELVGYKPPKDASEESLQVQLSPQDFVGWQGRGGGTFFAVSALCQVLCRTHHALLFLLCHSFHACFKEVLKNTPMKSKKLRKWSIIFNPYINLARKVPLSHFTDEKRSSQGKLLAWGQRANECLRWHFTPDAPNFSACAPSIRPHCPLLVDCTPHLAS